MGGIYYTIYHIIRVSHPIFLHLMYQRFHIRYGIIPSVFINITHSSIYNNPLPPPPLSLSLSLSLVDWSCTICATIASVAHLYRSHYFQHFLISIPLYVTSLLFASLTLCSSSKSPMYPYHILFGFTGLQQIHAITWEDHDSLRPDGYGPSMTHI